MMWGWGWGGWVLGSLMMIVFWGALVALVVWVVRGWGGAPMHGDEGRAASDARDILAERFARGEISEEEFAQRRRVLERRAS